MQTSKTDHVMINRWIFDRQHTHLSFRKLQLVRSTSSAHIAVDRKHYLHYKHFSTAETVSLDENREKFLVYSVTCALCNQIVFDVTPPKPKKKS